MKYYSRLLVLVVLGFSVVVGTVAKAQSEDEIILEGPVDLASLGPNTNPTLSDDLQVTATVSYARRGVLSTATGNGTTELLDIQSAETVSVEVIFPPDLTGQTLIVEALDGGAVDDNGKEKVGDEGSALVNFTAGTKPGLYRVRVSGGAAVLLIKFWLSDPSNPDLSVLVPSN